jgi:putative ABC transport system permease protein
MVLLIGAGLMIKSLARLLRVDGGFRTDNVLTMELELDGTRYSNTPAVLNFWQQSLDRVRAIPGVKIAAIGTALPLTGDHSRTDISFADMATPERGQYPHPDVHVISGGYIEAMGIPLLKGRSIADTDTETSPLVGLINEKLAQRYFKDQDPIGKQFMWGRVTPGKAPKWMTVVGIVADTKLYGLDNPSRFEVYVPYRQNEQQDMHVVVRSSVDPGSLTSSVREALASVDKNQPAFGIATMQKMESDAVSDRRSTLLLLSVFSGFALLLAGMGIYGVIAFSTARRTHEIGIRVALGAQRGDILRMILGECARLAFLGVGIGVVAALGLTRLMSTMLYGVGASDPLTFVAVAGILILVAFAACWLPARRAMRVDPMIALRYE